MVGDLISFDDNDEDEESLLIPVDPSQKEPSIDSCIDALDVDLSGTGASFSDANDSSINNSKDINNQKTTIVDSSYEKTPDRQSSNISGEFEVVTEKDGTSAIKSERNSALLALGRPQPPLGHGRKLREGFRWQKQLVFR